MAEKQAPTETTSDDNIPWDALSWWLFLVVAILAIPSLGYIIVSLTGLTDLIGIAVFMVTCWACTYFGMHLVKHPNMNEKKDITQQ